MRHICGVLGAMVPNDLLEFRQAIAKLDRMDSSSDRRHEIRYAPSESLSKASVQFRLGPGRWDADVIDLSPNGIRLALPPGETFREGERCQILISPNPSTIWALEGEIRWVTLHPYITVFGVLLDPDNVPMAPV